MFAVTACFLHVCALLPFQPPAHTCSTPCTTDTDAFLDSLVGPPASVTWVLLGSPVRSPQPPPRSRISFCSPEVSGAPSQISDDEVPIPLLHVTSLPQPSAHAAAPSPADSDDNVPILCFSHRTALVSCMAMLRFLFRAPVFLAFPPPPPLLLFALNLPCRLAAAANALLGMVNSELLPLLHPHPPSPHQPR
jgi:hypothetical protein